MIPGLVIFTCVYKTVLGIGQPFAPQKIDEYALAQIF